MTHPVVEIARAWTDAWNALDADALVALAHPEIAVTQMNGQVSDRDGLRDMVAKQTYGVALKVIPGRIYGRGDLYVAAVRGEFRYVESGELAGTVDDAAMTVELRDGAVVSFAPSPSLADALAAAGLGEDDLIADVGADAA